MVFGEPKIYPKKDCECDNVSNRLKPHIKIIHFRGNKTIYDIDFWYCPSCGRMYYFEDDTSIVEIKESPQ